MEVDHIIAVSKGGSNESDNLITSCFDCNRGKSANDLTCVPKSIEEKAKVIQEKEDQYLEFKKMQKRINRRINKEVEEINNIYISAYEGYELTEKFRRISVKKFIISLGFYEVEDAMNRACFAIRDAEAATKYFCGICWNKIREGL